MNIEAQVKKRIDYLDGLRGIAILLVFLYHCFSRWPDFVPYGAQFSNFSLAKYGWLGVELFFMISGFVIYMTLEKCHGFFDFVCRRWLRLFPGMVIATCLVFFSSGFFMERPAGVPSLPDLIPGLLFIEPSWISNIFNVKQGILEGAFWSLFVEVKFYVFFGGLFFLFNGSIAKICLGMAFLASIAIRISVWYFVPKVPIIGYLDNLANSVLSFNYFGWFLIGVLAYDLFQKKSVVSLVLISGLSALACMYTSIGDPSRYTGMFGSALVVVFILPVFSPLLRRILASKFLVFIGFISYPFYLIHENFSIAMIIKIGKAVPGFPSVLMPIFPFIAVCIISFAIANYFEPLLRGVFIRGMEIIKVNRRRLP